MDAPPAIEILEHALKTHALETCSAEKVDIAWLGVDASAVPVDLARVVFEGDICRSRPELRASLLTVDGGLEGPLTLRPHLSVWVRVPVSASPVASGEPVKATEGLVLAERVRGQTFLTAGVARIALPAGSPLTSLVVEQPYDVESGATVDVRVRRGGVSVSADGTTLERARIGETLRVVNEATHITQVGVLVDKQTVEIP